MSVEFPANTANPTFYRTYSRVFEGIKENFRDVRKRVVDGISETGQLNKTETAIIDDSIALLHTLASGRSLWTGGTEWSRKQKNFPGSYNCTNIEIDNLDAFRMSFDFLMQGCGVGHKLTAKNLAKLPIVCNTLSVNVLSNIGAYSVRYQDTSYTCINDNNYVVSVGDTREGWAMAFYYLLVLATTETQWGHINITVDLGSVRPAGEPIKGFGGTTNPVGLERLFQRTGEIVSSAVGRSFNETEATYLLDECALCTVAGNVRRSACIKQYDADNENAPKIKDNLWAVDENGKWSIDPKKTALRMSNHTIVHYTKPSLEVIKASITKQFHSGEGAIQYAPEAIARASADILDNPIIKAEFIEAYEKGEGKEFLLSLVPNMSEEEVEHRLERYGLNPCAEILGSNFLCNLAEVNLNMLNPFDEKEQEKAFKAAGLIVCSLLHHQFNEPVMQYSRLEDPIIAACITGVFDFFVKRFGEEWLAWWGQGRTKEHPRAHEFTITERQYFSKWRKIVKQTVDEYCEKHGLKVPNRYTAVQPSGSKSLLTGASPGWHPPKSARYIRRITFRRDDPVALACLDYGYSVVPSQSCTDETGKLLDDPFDPRVTEWLVEIPVELPWAEASDRANFDPNKISAAAQFDFFMQVQNYYTTHNTSATIEFRENEIDSLSEAIHGTIHGEGGYISAALLARFDANETFPRLPFEPITKEVYDRMEQEVKGRRKGEDFYELLTNNMGYYDAADEKQEAQCTSGSCEFKAYDESLKVTSGDIFEAVV